MGKARKVPKRLKSMSFLKHLIFSGILNCFVQYICNYSV